MSSQSANAEKQEPSPLPPLDEKQRYTIEEAIAYLRTSRASLYEDINAERIKTIRSGKRRYVPGSEIIRVSSVPA